MTPPAATAAPRSHARRPARTAAPRAPRRVSGPARPQRAAAAPAAAVLAPPLGLRLARGAAALPDSRLLDRLARGRLWIAILGAGLVGIVFLQISLLQLNTGISRAVETTQTLERQNTALKSELSALAGGDRVQESAALMSFISPEATQPRFLDARTADAGRAARNIARPTPIQQLPLGMIPPQDGGTAGLVPEPTAAPVATEAPAAVEVAPAATTAAPATVQATAATAPAPVEAPAAPVQAPAPDAAAQAPVTPPATAAGGATATPQG